MVLVFLVWEWGVPARWVWLTLFKPFDFEGFFYTTNPTKPSQMLKFNILT